MKRALVLAVLLLACNDDVPRVEDPTRVPMDAEFSADASIQVGGEQAGDDAEPPNEPQDSGLNDSDVDRPSDAAIVDASMIDAATVDAAAVDAALDAAVIDAEVIDAAVIDAEVVDAQRIDAELPDQGLPGVPAGRTPCDLAGEGWVLWAFHYDDRSTSPRIDVWDAACDYSLAPNSACNVYDICRGGIGCEVPRLRDGAVHLSANNYYLQIRYNVQGLNFNQAWLFVEAQGTRGSGRFEATQPGLGGGFEVGPVPQGYQWYGMDWSDLLAPGDDPGLTAVRITPSQSTIAVRAVALCVR